jgi:uncharacterized membrane protein
MDNAMVESPGKPRTVDAGRGTAWWSESWALFMKNPTMWIIFGVIFMVGTMILGLIPFLGALVVAVLSIVIAGGWMLAARKLESGGTIEVGDLFLGFKDRQLNPLLVVGALAAGISLVIGLVMGVLGAGAVMGIAMGGAAHNPGGMMASAALGMVGVLVGLVLAFVLAMAFWFAPPLVVFRGAAPVDALKASWAASLANISPFVVYGIIWIVAAVVASIPFGLGWIVLMPLTMLGLYCSYKDIFEGQAAAADPLASPGSVE